MTESENIKQLKEILSHGNPKERKLNKTMYRICKQYANAYEYKKIQKKKGIDHASEQ